MNSLMLLHECFLYTSLVRQSRENSSFWLLDQHAKDDQNIEIFNSKGFAVFYNTFTIHFLLPPFLLPTLRGDKVSMLTHTYPRKPLGILKGLYAITTLAAHFMCGLMSDLVICKFRKVWPYMILNVLTETRCHWTTQTHNPSSSSLPPLLLFLLLSLLFIRN